VVFWNDMTWLGSGASGLQATARLGAIALFALPLLGACGTYNAEAAFASDFNCPGAVATRQDAPGRFLVRGCGRTAVYVCMEETRGLCAIQVGGEDPTEASSDGDYTPEPRRTEPLNTETRVENKGDEAVMVLELALDKALLRVTATPDKRADLVQLKVVRHEPSKDADACGLDWMLNGQVIVTPKAVPSRKGDILSQRVQVGRELIGEFGTAEKIALRSCKARWALNREQVQKLRDFMDRFEEEMAWKAPPRSGSTGGMLAPSGGWPAWSATTSLPTSATDAALDARALFKKLSPSVFKLEATRGEGTAQGSAVAVTTTELVTNCHVVQGALKLVLKQNKQEWPASVVRADPATDRCVVTGTGLMAQPVVGVRAYANLEVGESVYTLGSPVGLELTLSDGIISGRRDEQDRHYVQTTAPISPGSSGGGLFDARGNLVGVTTLVLAGRERLNQQLNFAIPADAFWQ
jgi:Trypsin-like peptidase domain